MLVEQLRVKKRANFCSIPVPWFCRRFLLRMKLACNASPSFLRYVGKCEGLDWVDDSLHKPQKTM